MSIVGLMKLSMVYAHVFVMLCKFEVHSKGDTDIPDLAKIAKTSFKNTLAMKTPDDSAYIFINVSEKLIILSNSQEITEVHPRDRQFQVSLDSELCYRVHF